MSGAHEDDPAPLLELLGHIKRHSIRLQMTEITALMEAAIENLVSGSGDEVAELKPNKKSAA